jgi:hypothetical protein
MTGGYGGWLIVNQLVKAKFKYYTSYENKVFSRVRRWRSCHEGCFELNPCDGNVRRLRRIYYGTHTRKFSA